MLPESYIFGLFYGFNVFFADYFPLVFSDYFTDYWMAKYMYDPKNGHIIPRPPGARFVFPADEDKRKSPAESKSQTLLMLGTANLWDYRVLIGN